MERSERRHRTDRTVAAQLRIARQSNLRNGLTKVQRQPGRLRKRNAMDCGRSNCCVCGNPRRMGLKNGETFQEKRQLSAFCQDREHLSEDVQELRALRNLGAA